MADTSFFKKLAREFVRFFDFLADVLGEELARKALVSDLGGDPTKPAPFTFPPAALDSIRVYVDSTDTSAEAQAAMLHDVVVLIDAVAANYEAWKESGLVGAEQSVHTLLDLLASNYVRLRLPRLFLMLQAVSLLEEGTSLNAPGGNSFVRIGNAFKALFTFLFHPGKVVENLDPETKGFEITDAGLRLAATVMTVVESVGYDIEILSDILYGWDGPGLDFDAAATPSGADLVSSRMLTFALAHRREGLSTESSDLEKLKVTFAMLPKKHGGPAAFVSFGGLIDVDVPLDERWQLAMKLEGGGALSVTIGHPTRFLAADAQHALRIGLATKPDPDTNLAFVLPDAKGCRLEFGQVSFALTLATGEAQFKTRIDNGAVVIESGDSDGFISHLLDRALGGVPMRLPFSIGVGYSSTRGLILEGEAPPFTSPARTEAPATSDSATTSAVPRLADDAPAPTTAQPDLPVLSSGGNVGASPAIDATIPIGRSFGPLTIHEVQLRLVREPVGDDEKIALDIGASFSARIGPVYARIEKLGISIAIDNTKPPEESNLRFTDLGLGSAGPQGVALDIDAGLVSGGGLLFHDAAQHLYAGALILTIGGGLSLKAIGLVATRTETGAKGFSLLVFITAEDFQPMPIGLGFTLRGIGGMLAIHRTFDERAMKEQLASGALRNVLFPRDPLHRIGEVLRSLTTLFPLKRGCYLFGPLVKIDWGTPVMIDLELAVLYEIREDEGDRIVILGRISSILPNRDKDLIRLNLDAFGIIDFDQGTVAIDAVLVDSRLVHKFALTGAMALRIGFKGNGPAFALAVGGMHPAFAPPAGFPKLARIAVALTTGDNPRLTCQAYIALTANTIQFGASAYLFAAALGFSVEGNIGFDVLIQIFPFHFIADFRASVQLKRGSHSLFKVKLQGGLEGPLPLRVRGKASFEILWCDFSVGFDATLAGGVAPVHIEGVDALGELQQALGDSRNWQAQLPPVQGQLVSLRQRARESAKGGTVLLHPLGSLGVRQSVVPLNLERDIDRLGAAAPSGARRFTITSATLGSRTPSRRSVRELFAPAQFFDMSDDEKLVAPSFESMDAGLELGDAGHVFDMANRAASKFDFKDITIGPDGASVEEPSPHRPDWSRIQMLALFGAAAQAPTRRTLAARFGSPPDADSAPHLRPLSWAAVDDAVANATEPLAPPPPSAAAKPFTWAEAQLQLHVQSPQSPPRARVLVPTFELA